MLNLRLPVDSSDTIEVHAVRKQHAALALQIVLAEHVFGIRAACHLVLASSLRVNMMTQWQKFPDMTSLLHVALLSGVSAQAIQLS
jgi:hypothetical protein